VAWSTRQLAELAGTTLKAVRHYHKVGLLDEPERGTNGYKQYGVAHLTRLLRIRRLTDLGLSLGQIAEMGEDDEHPGEALKALDAELAATIDRLQRVRDELAVILRGQLPTDLPAELAPVTDGLSEADRALMVVYGRVLGPDGMEAMRDMLAGYVRGPAAIDFDALPADADETVRQELAERFLPELIELLRANPGLVKLQVDAPGGSHHVTRTVDLAIGDVYNPAQLDVIDRVMQALSRLSAQAATAHREAAE
jgi:DNA-binding transcriptional MerR regulator